MNVNPEVTTQEPFSHSRLFASIRGYIYGLLRDCLGIFRWRSCVARVNRRKPRDVSPLQ